MSAFESLKWVSFGWCRLFEASFTFKNHHNPPYIRHSMHIVEPWRLFLLSSATLWRSRSIHGVKSTGAHGMRTCRPFASSAFGCECLLSPPASRCPRPG